MMYTLLKKELGNASGLDESNEEGIQLFEHILANVQQIK